MLEKINQLIKEKGQLANASKSVSAESEGSRK